MKIDWIDVVMLGIGVCLLLLILAAACTGTHTPGMTPHQPAPENPEFVHVAEIPIDYLHSGRGDVIKFRDGDVVCYMATTSGGAGISCLPCTEVNCRGIP